MVVDQPPPKPNDKPAVWDLVQPFNGRDALVDAFQEALDLCVYLRQAIYERDGR